MRGARTDCLRNDRTSAADRRSRSVWAVLAVAVLVGRCTDRTGPKAAGVLSAPILAAAIVSSPVPSGLAVTGSAPTPGAMSTPTLVYVSLPPGSIPTGVRAQIADVRTGGAATATMLDGGFDPVSLAADAGDTLQLQIFTTGSEAPQFYCALVSGAKRPPSVVRTDPPVQKRDVPLNATLLIVLSDPISPTTLTDGSVQLFQGSTPIAGTVTFADSAHTALQFSPVAPLAPTTDYQLVVTPGVQDVNGDSLTATVTVPFTTGASTPAASLVVSGFPSPNDAGYAATGTVTAQDGSGNTATGYTGTVHFNSTDPTAQLPPDYTFVAADAGSHTFTVTLRTAGSQTVTATDVTTSTITGDQTIALVVPPTSVYVASNLNFVTVYPAGATGNVTPTATISGSNTGLNNPYGIAVDGAGRIYVANEGDDSGVFSITVYAAGATGNAAPIATIAGANTGLDWPDGLAFDGAGRLYVANGEASTITVYAAGATGNATPIATIGGTNTGLYAPVGLAFDGAGRLYVANSGGANTVTVYAAGATGNAAPTATIAGANTGLSWPYGLAFDGAGRLYVGNVGNGNLGNDASSSITVYAAGATGNATPIATIAGSDTGLWWQLGLAVDGAGRVYACSPVDGPPSAPSLGGMIGIAVFAPGATGNVTPVAIIAGSNTNLSNPVATAVH